MHLPLGALELSEPKAMAWLQDWQKAAYEAGLVGCDYPREVGGGGAGLRRVPKIILSRVSASTS